MIKAVGFDILTKWQNTVGYYASVSGCILPTVNSPKTQIHLGISGTLQRIIFTDSLEK